MAAYLGPVKRQVKPEILDLLPMGDPAAVRSRRDLRLINFLMGNERWIMKQELQGGAVELGAGAGELTRKIASQGAVVGLDLQCKPQDLELAWKSGNLFETLPETPGDTVVANLILHHFEDDQLARLGTLIKSRKRFVAVEPWRSKVSLAEGFTLWPFINQVTKHDMIVSIKAGFRRGELPDLLQLGEEWEWREEVSLLGGIRVLAWRR